MKRKSAGQKSGRGKKTVFGCAVLFFICLMCSACAQSTSADNRNQEPPVAASKEPPVVGTEPPVAKTEKPSAEATELPAVETKAPSAAASDEPSSEATEAPAAETKEPPTDSTAEPREILEYNGIPVHVYKMEKNSTKDGYASRAEFEFEGVPYELYDFGRNDEEHVAADIEDLIDHMCKNPAGILADVFGNEEYCVRIRFRGIGIRSWHYYVETENGMKCVAEMFGPSYCVSEVYSVDVDNDGRKELICNCVGTRATVWVYRENGGVIERGWVERGYCEKELGLNHMIEGEYDPEEGAFVVSGWNMEDHSRRTATFWGLEHFEFQEFAHEKDY